MKEAMNLQAELEEVMKKKEQVIEAFQYELASALRDREKRLLQLIEEQAAI